MVNREKTFLAPLLTFSLFIAFCVIVLGAYVRLTDAGLGCPDWPGCYGQLLGVPQSSADIQQAQALYPDTLVDSSKAWNEMAHRYLAGSLGLLVLALLITGWNTAKRRLLLWLSATVLFQALLGMWTVTLLLQPIIVVMHLLGGLTVLSLLWWLRLDRKHTAQTVARGRNNKWVAIGTALLVAQIALGGWTSSNYAALACADFPTCGGQWLPHLDDSKAFAIHWEEDKNYEFGTLDSPARSAIHMIHRIGALAVFIYFAAMLSLLFYRNAQRVRKAVVWTAGILCLQISLGISNVIFSLPLSIAVAHNGVAALLLLSVLYLLKYVPPQRI